MIRLTGGKAFRQQSRGGRVKEPDMIGDFFATQWFLWNSVSSIKNAAGGVSLGQSWRSKLSVPAPMVLRKARDVTYTFEQVQPGQKGSVAVLSGVYGLSDLVPAGWPVPYSGEFQAAGRFGMLGYYRVLELQGQGRELFNIDAGQVERSEQHYIMVMDCSFPMGLINTRPKITINQAITMQLIQ